MLTIKLPDGNNLKFPKEVTGLEIAEKISKSLYKEALIMSVNGELKDLYFSIKEDSLVKIFTAKDPEGLEVIRHDAAHIMAMAVQELYPGTQVTIGPVIENGFYYDFARKDPFTDEDLKKIEKRMSEIIDKDVKTRREVWDRDKAIKHLKRLEKSIRQKLSKVFLKVRSFQFTITVILGTIYVEGHIYYLLAKLVKLLNLLKYQGHIGVVTLIMKCFKEFMELDGQPRKT